MVLHVQLETSMEDQESIYTQTVPGEFTHEVVPFY